MNRYLLIESLDPFESNDVARYWELAASLAREGNQVTLFLVQNGVLAARAGARSGTLQTLAEAGVQVLADDFSLRERGIREAECGAGVAESNIAALVDLLVAGNTKAVWH